LNLKLADIPELPSESHPYCLLPVRRVAPTPELSLDYRQAGQGDPVLLLPGLWTTSFTFRGLIEPLQETHRLLFPDLLDPSGKNQLPDDDYGPAALAASTLRLMDALELDRVCLVGHAEQGLAGLELAMSHPDRLAALVVIGTCIKLPTSARLAGWWRSRSDAAGWAKAGFAQPDRAAMAMLDYADPAVISRQEIRHLAAAWTSLPGARARARILAQTLTGDYPKATMERLEAHMAEGHGIDLPLELVYGKLDHKATPKQGQDLNRLMPGSELLVAEHSGGTVQVESPRWTAQIIEAAASKASF
jgi:pimeloyl-ACP methyl ester carboxylesterase